MITSNFYMERLNCLNTESIILLNKNGLLKPLVRAELIKSTLSKVELDKTTTNNAINAFREKLNIIEENQYKEWLDKNKIDLVDFEYTALEKSRLDDYCKNNFNHKIESHFLSRKDQLDIVIYSLIRTRNYFLANELYLRVKENEEDFGALATLYSEGVEKKTRGIIGPLPIQKSHPKLAEFLKNSKPGQVSAPIEIQNYHLVIRLESYDPAKLDDSMRKNMGIELFNIWANNQSDIIVSELLNKVEMPKNQIVAKS